MNEITKVHLGRQAFTVSIEVQAELESYLEAIKKEVKKLKNYEPLLR